MESERLHPQFTRRDFLRQGTGAASAGLAVSLTGFPAILTAQNAAPRLRIGLVGCGGRGSGAAAQALSADDNTELTALADVFPNNLQNSLDSLSRTKPGQVNVPAERQFIGLDAYQKLIESCVDVVLLATPPGFRPQHFRACVDAGKHVFIEKPMAVDGPGVRSVIESVAESKKKQLAVVAGFCWRYSSSIRAAFEQIHSGTLGSVLAYYATYYTGPVKPMPPASARPPGISDVEWQVRNWYNFTWTCGDGIVEQAVHSVDKIAWAMRDQPPIACVASGGRQLPNHEGNIFDHVNVTYEYPEGVLAFLGCRQIPNCFNENSDYIVGSTGQCILGRGRGPFIAGSAPWRFRGDDNDMYQQEHDELFASIRRGEPINDGDRMASSTLLAIMGRMAAYTGQRITWEEALNSKDDLAPDDLAWNDSFPIRPIAQPGVTPFS
jgi:predicted dehydrogenase